MGSIVGNVWFDRTLLVAKWRRSTAIPRKCHFFPRNGFVVEAYSHAFLGPVHWRHVVSVCPLGRNRYDLFSLFQKRQRDGGLTVMDGVTPRR
jgi:hypothetical protein